MMNPPTVRPYHESILPCFRPGLATEESLSPTTTARALLVLLSSAAKRGATRVIPPDVVQIEFCRTHREIYRANVARDDTLGPAQALQTRRCSIAIPNRAHGMWFTT